jgi:hypothetical protein
MCNSRPRSFEGDLDTHRGPLNWPNPLDLSSFYDLDAFQSIEAKKVTPTNPPSPTRLLLSLEVSPAKVITVLEAVGVDEPVGTVVVEFAVLFNATQIFGTRVAKARCQNSASVSSNSIFFQRFKFSKTQYVLCSSVPVQVDEF